MTKWICTKCSISCEATTNTNLAPKNCLLWSNGPVKPLWHHISDSDPEQATKYVGGRCACTYFPIIDPQAPLAGCPPFKRDEQSSTYDKERYEKVGMCDQHERDIQEMAGSLKSLKERVTALEQTAVKCNPNTALAWATKYHEMENRIDVLEGRSEGLILSPIQVESKVAGLEAWQSCAKYQIENLEHQMRKHYHSGNVWVESEDGSESVMQ